MKTEIKNLGEGQTELKIELELSEFEGALIKASAELSEIKNIPGYRPGKAPYDVVKSNFGEMAIYDHALPKIIQKSYVEAITSHQLVTWGEPKISVTTLAPGNPIAYIAIVTLVPKIEKLVDFKKVVVEEKAINVKPEDAEKTIGELSRMQTRETEVKDAVGPKHKAVVDLDLFKEGVAVEGGTARDHGIYLQEDYYIPGIKEALLGMQINENKTFTVTFPKDHFQKHLAGHEIEVKMTVKNVFDLNSPELNDDFAKSLGQESLTKLRERIEQNIREDLANKEHERAETELLEKLVAESKFEDIPEAMINEEVERMIKELEHSLSERKIEMTDYLKNIKKTLTDLKTGFAAQAVMRIKSALLMREVGINEKIEVDDGEVLRELTTALNEHKDQPELQEYARSDEYQDRIRMILRNRKIMGMLHGVSVKHI